jgi:hypothetical protein
MVLQVTSQVLLEKQLFSDVWATKMEEMKMTNVYRGRMAHKLN